MRFSAEGAVAHAYTQSFHATHGRTPRRSFSEVWSKNECSRDCRMIDSRIKGWDVSCSRHKKIRIYDPLFRDLTIALYPIPINAEDGVVTMTLCTCLSLIHVNYFHVTPISMTRMAHIFSSKYTFQKACEKTRELYKARGNSVESFEISERVGVVSYSQRVKSSRTKRPPTVRNATECP